MHVIVVVLQASMASAHWLTDWLYFTGFGEEITTTTTGDRPVTTTTTTSGQVALTNDILEKLEHESDQPLRYFLMSPLVLAVAFMFLVIWHFIGFIHSIYKDRESWIGRSVRFVNYWIKNDNSRTFFLGVIVLQFYYSDTVARNIEAIHENPFMCSCALLFIDSVFFWLVGDVIIKRWYFKIPLVRTRAKRMKIKNIYMKVSCTLQRTIMYFFVQGALMLFYIYSLNDKEKFQSEENVSYMKWMVAMVLTAIAGEDEVGTKFDFDFWEALDSDPLGKNHTTFFYCINVPLKYQWRARAFFSVCVNLIFRQVILGTAPVMLSVAGPLDFIRDALAVFFITKLDDVEDNTDFDQVKKELIEDLKYNEYDVVLENVTDGSSDPLSN
jgi:hypothetical protein